MSMLLQATEAVAETTEQTMGLGELFLAGGWLMWPLLLLGGVTIFIFCERFWAIKQASRMDVNFMNRIRAGRSRCDPCEHLRLHRERQDRSH